MDNTASEAPESKLHFLDYWRIIRIRKAVILTVFLLVALTTTLLTWVVLKPEYASTVRISVEKDATDVDNPIGNRTAYYGHDPFWVQTQYEKIQSRSILYDVIDKLKLHTNPDWTRKFNAGAPLKTEECYLLLRGKMKVRQWRNTSLIEVTIFSNNKDEAALIANTVAEVYRDSRLEQRREIKFGGIRTLEKRLEEKNQEVERAQQVVQDMRRTNNIIELSADGVMIGSSSQMFYTETLRLLEQQRLQAEFEYDQYNSLLKEVKQLNRDELKAALPTAMPFPDQQLVTMSQDLTLAQQKLSALLQDFSREHPDVKRAQAVVDVLETHIEERVSGIVQGLDAKVASAADRLEKIHSKVEAAKARETALAAVYRPYFDAKRELENLLRVRDAMKLKIDQENIDASLPITTAVEITDPAVPGIKPVKPNKILNVGLGVIVGLMLGVGLVFFIEYLDTSVKTIDDVERALQAPVLAVIPQNVDTLLYEGPESPHAEAYRVLRTNILFARKDDTLNTITVVSGGVGEGKSTTLLNLATVFAQNGDRVLVVDSDLRRPSLHKLFKVSNSVGLTNYLLKQNSLDEVVQTTPLPSLDFLPSGKLPSSSMGILSSDQMKNLILELKRRYDFVFFDSPPIMGVSDASILASEVDMTLQVIQYRRYPQPMTIRAKQMIQKVGGNLIGIVLNNINVSQDENYYYYSGYYHDYYSSSNQEAAAGKETAKLELKQKY